MSAKSLSLFVFIALAFYNTGFSQEITEVVLSGDQVELTADTAEGSCQWQESSDNVNWTDIDGATEISYTFVASGTSGLEKFYRASIENTGCGAGEMFYSSLIHHVIIEDLSELEAGDYFRGGIVFNYTMDGTEKRIASAQDDTTAVRWGCAGQNIHTTYDDGQFNTTNITDECSERPIAASVCHESELNGYTDWHLPSNQELYRLNQAEDIVGGFNETYYWTSTEEGTGGHYRAWSRLFNLNMSYTRVRNETDAVRCIRPVLSSGITRSYVVFDDLPNAVSISSHPEAISVCSSAPAVFSVTAEGTEPLSYQWFKDEEELTGFTQNTLSIDEANPGNEGIYRCEITNECGTVSSDEAELKVIQLTVDAGDDDGFCQGSSYAINASAFSNHPDESGTLQYSWTPTDGLDGTDILNPLAQPSESTIYTLTVTDQKGCSALDSFHLTLLEPVAIEIQPLSQQACPGEDISFSISASGSETISYQWLKDGEIIADAIENTLSLQDITDEDTGIYTCEVTNSCGTLTSDDAELEMHEPLSILTQPVSQSICHEEELTLSVVVSGEEPVSYQWKKDGTDILDATGSNFVIDNANLEDEGIYTCEITNICSSITSAEAIVKVIIISADAGEDETICPGDIYQINASASSNHPEESGNFLYSWLPAENLNDPNIPNPEAQPDETTTYILTVTDEIGCSVSDSLTLTLSENLYISLQPSSQTICKNSEVEFSVITEGGNNVNYQWEKDGQPIDDATDNNYYIDEVSLEDEGIYTCIITDNCGTISTEEAELNVIAITVDAGQDETICLGNHIQLNASASSNYPDESGIFTWLWEPSSGLSDPNIANPLAGPENNIDYKVFATDLMGCADSDTITVQVELPWENQQICFTSVEPASQKTQIIWSKTPDVGIAGFNLYRKTNTEDWELAGYVPYDEPALYTDMASDPGSVIQKYRIAVTDTCGNESSASFYHSPVFLHLPEENNPEELNWTHYDDEAGEYTPSKYYIYRGISSENMTVFDSVPSTLNSYNIEIQEQTYLYKIGILKPEECNNNNAPNVSYSNIVTVDAGTFVAHTGFHKEDEIIVSPNPFRYAATIRFSNPANEEFILQLINSKGQTVLRITDLRNETLTLRGNDLKPGVYFIELRSSKRILRGKTVIE